MDTQYKTKWKIGDLVTLSAAGRRVEGNYQVREGFGMIISIGNRLETWPIRTKWIGGGIPEAEFKEYELKTHKSKEASDDKKK